MLLTSTRRCRGVVALEPLPEVARALKRSLQMNGWEEKSQVRPGVLSSKCCVKIWKTWKFRMKFGWDTTNILINKRPPKKSKLVFYFLRIWKFASAPGGCWFFYISSLGARWSRPLQAPRVAGDACIFWAMLMEIHMLAHQCHGNIWVFLRCFLNLPDVGQGSVCLLPKCFIMFDVTLRLS